MDKGLCLWLAVMLIATPLCAEPILKGMHPHGAQSGSAVRLVLNGESLGSAPRLISQLPAIATPLTITASEEKGQNSELVYLLEVPKDASTGIYPLRIETQDGISNALLFAIGEFPQVEELEAYPPEDAEVTRNDFRETAQVLAQPVTVEGRLQGAERDLYRFQASAGQNLVAEIASRRVGSAIDPNLELLDTNGKPYDATAMERA